MSPLGNPIVDGEPQGGIEPAAEAALRTGTASAEQLAELEKRVSSLEGRGLGDNAAIAPQYTINNAGEVTNVVNEIITESPAEQLKNKHGGKFLRVNPVTGVLEWAVTGNVSLSLLGGVTKAGGSGFESGGVGLKAVWDGVNKFVEITANPLKTVQSVFVVPMFPEDITFEITTEITNVEFGLVGFVIASRNLLKEKVPFKMRVGILL